MNIINYIINDIINCIINYITKHPENKSTSTQTHMENFLGNCVKTPSEQANPVPQRFHPFPGRKIRNILGIGAINRCYVRSG